MENKGLNTLKVVYKLGQSPIRVPYKVKEASIKSVRRKGVVVVLGAGQPMELVIIRAGKTKSGAENRYLTDESEGLLPEEVERLVKMGTEGVYPPVSRVYISSATRCQQTAYALYKNMPGFVVEGLHGFHYGSLEGHTYPEIAAHPQVRENLLKKELLPIPDGESPYIFTARVLSSFRGLLAELEHSNLARVALVTHGTVIRTLLRRYAVPRSLHIGVDLAYGEGLLYTHDYETGTGVVTKYFIF